MVNTIKVKHPDGYMIINKEDFNPKIHTEYKKNETQKKEEKTSKKIDKKDK